MIRHVVVRYSSLGDVILAASVTGALGDVAFVTEPRYHELVRRFPGVVQALAPDDPVPAGARIIDLHHNLRSARVAADVRVQRTDFRRRARVWLKVPPGPSVVQRYGRAAGVTPSPPPWLPPIVRGTALILAPGAAHATKRWPWFVPLARAWDGPVRAVGGVADQPIVDAIGGVAEAGFAGTLAAMEGGAVLCGGDTGILHLAAAV